MVHDIRASLSPQSCPCLLAGLLARVSVGRTVPSDRQYCTQNHWHQRIRHGPE